MNDPAPVRFSLPEKRTERMTGLVTPSTKADWEIQKITHNLSVGDLVTLAVELIKTHPEIMSKDYELREKD